MIPPILLPVMPQNATLSALREGGDLALLTQAFGVLIEEGEAVELPLELAVEPSDEEDLEALIPVPAPSTPLVEAIRADLVPLEAPLPAAPLPHPQTAVPAAELPVEIAPVALPQQHPHPQPVQITAPVTAAVKPQAPKAFAALLEPADVTASEDAPESAPILPALPRLKPEIAPSAAPAATAATVMERLPEPSAPPLEALEGFAPAEVAEVEDRAAPLKIAEAPAPIKLATPLVRNVIERLSEVEMQEGKTRILLRPQGLGVLEIDMVRRMDGQIQLAIRVENPMILEALRQEGQALESFMGERGFDLSGGGAQFERYSPPAAEDTEEAAPEEVAAQADLLQADRLDIVT